jgi:hypothetical protein
MGQQWGIWVTVEYWAAVDGGHDWHGTLEEARAKIAEWTTAIVDEPLPPGVRYEAWPYTGKDPA